MGQLSMGFVVDPHLPRVATCFYYTGSQQRQNFSNLGQIPVKSNLFPKDFLQNRLITKLLPNSKNRNRPEKQKATQTQKKLAEL